MENNVSYRFNQHFIYEGFTSLYQMRFCTKLLIYWCQSQILTLREKCPNSELFLVRIFPHSDWIRARNNSVFGHFHAVRALRFPHRYNLKYFSDDLEKLLAAGFLIVFKVIIFVSIWQYSRVDLAHWVRSCNLASTLPIPVIFTKYYLKNYMCNFLEVAFG